jgi:hypothetical protein
MLLHAVVDCADPVADRAVAAIYALHYSRTRMPQFMLYGILGEAPGVDRL